MAIETRPCENCGIPVTKTPRSASHTRAWTCGKPCAGKMRIKAGRVARTWQPNRFRGVRETRSCARCGREIERYVTEQNHDQPWKCSRTCAVRDLQEISRPRRGDVIPCAVCGKPFYREPSKPERKYCSTECANRGRVVPIVSKPCKQCGTEIKLRQTEVHLKTYCSSACATAGKFKNTIDRTHNGRPVRVTADGYLLIWEPDFAPPSLRGWALEHRVVVSRVLGRSLLSTEEVDHIDDNRSNNDPSNLQVLGKAAHRKKTGENARKRRVTLRERAETLDREIADLERKIAAYREKYGPLPQE